MSQIGFYMAGAGVSLIGGAGLLIAWDLNDRGPSAADDIDLSGIALYTWIGQLSTLAPAVFKMRSKSPFRIPEDGRPDTLDGSPDRDFVVRFAVKPPSTTTSLFADVSLEVFEGQNRIYGISAAGATATVELAQGSAAFGLSEYSMKDRLEFAALEDPLEGWTSLLGGVLQTTPAIEIWRDLMTPNQELKWSPL